jgi:CRISPR-associated protein Cas2
MDLLLTYDIATHDRPGERRLRRVAKIAEGHGMRVQYSVFELVLDPYEVPGLLHQLERVIDNAQDNIRIYRLGSARPMAILGRQRDLTTTRGPLIL